MPAGDLLLGCAHNKLLKHAKSMSGQSNMLKLGLG